MSILYRRAYMTQALISVLVLVYIAEMLTGGGEGMNLVSLKGAYYTPLVYSAHEWYRLLTAAFIHFGFAHLLSNAFSLFIVGPYIERALGRIGFIVVSLTAAVFGNLLTLFDDFFIAGTYTYSAGASGIVSGLVGSFVVLSMFTSRDKSLPFRNLLIALLLVILPGVGDSGINVWAHAGGLIGGSIVSLIWSLI